MLYVRATQSLPLEISRSVFEFFILFSFDRVVMQKNVD